MRTQCLKRWVRTNKWGRIVLPFYTSYTDACYYCAPDEHIYKVKITIEFVGRKQTKESRHEMARPI